MSKIAVADLRKMAASCVADMGDIFWDWECYSGAKDGYADPSTVARAAVLQTLIGLAERLGVVVKQ
ncbi:MAG: hypothetical protein IT463_05220 [Planctomycetes bacterium]|nr:hypothetical protein [Planctomycetota bacterium]